MKLTKNQKINYVNSYLRSNDTELWQVYGSFSNEKARSFENIKRRMRDDGGYDLRILGHNSSTYSCAYQRNNDLVVDTWRNTYVIENWRSL